mmetsp:Transcript_85195/g.183695  ORF Transcript_85195/g.183695 Transcript_85195/m.183695 type:complete len:129 (+) Transcript_85195:70-456(+)
MTAPATEPAPAGFRTKVDRLAEARRAKLEGMAEDLASQHSAACKEAHVRKKRELTWGCILPTIMPGKDEDLDEVLELLAQRLKDSRFFTKTEWCAARAPTTWKEEPSRFGGHVQLRVQWKDEAGDLLG